MHAVNIFYYNWKYRNTKLVIKQKNNLSNFETIANSETGPVICITSIYSHIKISWPFQRYVTVLF